MINQNLLLTGDDGYNLTKSLRFRSSASATLSRTPASASNQQKWTLSTWVKRGTIYDATLDNYIFGAGSSGSNRFLFGFGNTTENLAVVATNSGSNVLILNTTPVYRDPSAWYHMVLAIDTTQATASNRAILYVNGVQVTAFSTATYPAQNTNLVVNATNAHAFGSRGYAASDYYDGYMTEINFVDGQQLAPSSFGSTNALTGVWQPAKYTGTYGTNGFYLPFTNTASTTALGYDFSGNSNNWTTNNFSISSNSTYDSMKDVPTLTSATTANYCVLNPLDKGSTSSFTFSDGNLKSANSDASNNYMGRATLAVSSGKWYWEVTLSAGTSAWAGGIATTTTGLSYGSLSSGSAYAYSNNGNSYNGQTGASYGATYTAGDVIGVALDLDAGTLVFYKNGTSQGTAFTGISGTYAPAYLTNSSTVVANFGQQPFSYTPPTGFVALNTFNLPEPSIKAGNAHFDATTYSGTGSSQSIVNSGGFQPSLVWLKTRNVGYGHALFDAVRGVGNGLQSNSTNAEAAWGTSTLASFNSNGFGLGADTSYLIANSSGNTFVGWQWKGNGTGSSNTAGSITSTVSANPTAGFSVVTYNTGSAGNQTVGHGLGATPAMIIIKSRVSGSAHWDVWHKSFANPAQGYMYLNLTNAVANDSRNWANTAPTSSVFSFESGYEFSANANYVAYCWSEVAGYSKFGSYTGNGSTDGTFVHLGFRPKFLMVKCSSNSSTNWFILDTTRDTYNLSGQSLMPNLSNAEYTPASSGYFGDILSNGFKWRDASNNANNASGYTYIYMAFAENPFKYSLAR